MLVLAPYGFIPPIYGGHERCFNLYANLGSKFNVVILALNWGGELRTEQINSTTVYVEIPAEPKVLNKARILNSQLIGDSWDLMIPLCHKELDGYSAYLDAIVEDQDLIILAHPWMSHFWKKNWPPVVYDAHNVEHSLFEDLYGAKSNDARIAEISERNALNLASGVSACSLEDLDLLTRDSKTTNKAVIPNGVDDDLILETLPTNPSEKEIVFLGSAHLPNINAAKRVLMLADRLPQWNFSFIGGVCDSLPKVSNKNVRYRGFISENDLNKALKECAFFINPMVEGSGTHLKMIRAFANGCFVLTTSIGARGFENNFQTPNFLICENLESFEYAILNTTTDAKLRIRKNALDFARRLGWKSVVREYEEFLERVINIDAELNRPQQGVENVSFKSPTQRSPRSTRRNLIYNFSLLLKFFWQLLPFQIRTRLFPLRKKLIQSLKNLNRKSFSLNQSIAVLKRETVDL